MAERIGFRASDGQRILIGILSTRSGINAITGIFEPERELFLP